MAGPEVMDPHGCVRQPSDLDWPAQPAEVVLNGALNQVPEALAEAARRGLPGLTGQG